MQFIETARQWGFLRAIWSGLMHLVRRWFVLCRISRRRIDPNPKLSDLGDGLVMRRASREDLLNAVDNDPHQFDLAFVDEALARGDICIGAFHGSEMVAWAWASFHKAPHDDGLWVHVEPPNNYGYKWFTKPAYRGKRIIGTLTLFRDKIAAESGCTHNMGFIETHNYASLHGSKRLGSQRVGYAGYFKLFGKAYPFRTPGVAKHGFRFVRA